MRGIGNAIGEVAGLYEGRSVQGLSRKIHAAGAAERESGMKIVHVLAALLLPAIGNVRAQARRAKLGEPVTAVRSRLFEACSLSPRTGSNVVARKRRRPLEFAASGRRSGAPCSLSFTHLH